ncbi:MAG: DUF368 domain-containing protein [Anaeroplasmataceae bacterium]|nr:DUF368 domain-containing protein [Anaeroplasmataceae bacterium]
MLMEHLIKFVKGIAIGIANIIPGFSGGTMAVIVKVYDEFVSALASLTKTPLVVLKKSWSLFLGILIGVIIGFVGIVKLLEIAPLVTILFFFGLVLGSIPKQGMTALTKPINPKTWIAFGIAFAIIVLLPFLSEFKINQIEEINFANYIIIFLLGILSSAAMVLPGLSGSMILLIFGYYHFIMSSAKVFVKGFFTFEFSGLLTPFLALLCLAIGIAIGIIVMSKIVKKLYTKYPSYCNMAIFGLLIASLFAILYSSNVEYNHTLFNVSAWQWFVGIVLAILGTLCTISLDFLGSRKKEEEVVVDDNQVSNV